MCQVMKCRTSLASVNSHRPGCCVTSNANIKPSSQAPLATHVIALASEVTIVMADNNKACVIDAETVVGLAESMLAHTL